MNSLKSTSTHIHNPHEWSTETHCMVFVNNGLLVNNFDIKVGFLPTVENSILNDMALDQVEIFFSLFMHNSIIMNKKDYEENVVITKLENNVIMIPDNPNDQTIGSLIFSKLVAIVGDNLDIEYVRLSSELGKNITYTIDAESPELEALLPSKSDWWEDDKVMFSPWWLRPDTATYDVLINRDEIYHGDIAWEEIFKDEIERLKESENKTKGKFKIINGGKDEVK